MLHHILSMVTCTTFNIAENFIEHYVLSSQKVDFKA